MANNDIEEKGYSEVIKHEKKYGREAELVRKDGYDIVSKAKGEIVRRIEVKSTSKSYLNFRWLEEKEYLAFEKYDNFYLYIVTNTENKPVVWEFSKKRLLAKKMKKVIKYSIPFRKKEFEIQLQTRLLI